MTDTDNPVTRDELEHYRLSVVTAAARLRADHQPEFAYEISLCAEADRYTAGDPALKEIYGQTLREEANARAAQRDSRQARVSAALATQHDIIADKLEQTIATARRLVIEDPGPTKGSLLSLIVDFADVMASALLIIGAELHDDG